LFIVTKKKKKIAQEQPYSIVTKFKNI